MKLRVATYNIHKGFTHFNRRMMLHELRHHLRTLAADIVFLQEVQGSHQRHAACLEDWPAEPQHQFLADQVWQEYAYGKNAVYTHGDHGNAILSRFPIVSEENQDVSAHRFEHRGLLHCLIDVDGRPVHCLCLHLGLHEWGRRRQVAALTERVERLVPEAAPLIVAGDFNDWRNRVGRNLAATLALQDLFADRRGRPARTFPSGFPLLRLDRIYSRGFTLCHAEVHHGLPWSRLSDHAPLSAELELP